MVQELARTPILGTRRIIIVIKRRHSIRINDCLQTTINKSTRQFAPISNVRQHSKD